MVSKDKIRSLVIEAGWRAGRIAAPLGRALFFSAADEHIAYKKELCISIEKGGVSVAYGTRFLSSVSIKGSVYYPFKDTVYPQPKEAASAVMLAVNELGLSAGSAVLGIPKAMAAVKIADFPATVKDNIQDVITYELDRLLPFSPDSASYDFMVAGGTPEKITVVVAAARAEVIRSYCEAMQEAGISVDRVTLNTTAMGEVCRSAGRSEDFVFAWTDGSEYEGALFIDGRFCGVVNESLDGADDSSKAGMITAGLRSLVDAARKRDGSLRPPVLMRGGGSVLAERLKTELGLPVLLLEGYSADAGSYSAAAGGVLESLRPGSQRLNLLSGGRHKAPARPKTLSIILALILLSCWIFSVIAPVQQEKEKLGEIERQINLRKSGMKGLDALRKEIDDEKGRIETVTNFKEGSPTALAILKELTAVLPKSVWLTRVRITRSTVEIEGYSSSASELLSRLEASKYFRKAEFSSPSFRDMRMNADRFSVKTEIRGVKEAEEKGAQKKNERK